MNRLPLFAIVAFVIALAALPVSAGAQANKAATLTFLSASCDQNSALYIARQAGQDPRATDHGTPADPTDISAYGCENGPALEFFLLGGSTNESVFASQNLKNPLKVSASIDGYDGSATLIASNTMVYLEGGKSLTRRFSVRGYPTTVTTAAELPFLDLHCGADGVNNDNADGLGWDNLAVAAGTSNYCIAYIFEESTAPPAVENAKPEPVPGNEIKLMIHKRAWSDKGKGKWLPQTPPGQATFILADANGVALDTFNDGQNYPLQPGDYIVTEQAGSMELYDFFISGNGASDCPDTPPGGRTSVTLGAEHFSKPGTLHLCAFNREPAAGPVAALSKSFVSETDGVVTWRIEPTSAADLWVWDDQAVTCQAFAGATCGKGNNPHRLYANEPSQYLLVTQPVEHHGESCEVTNTAQWATSKNGDRDSVSATYKCSGAPTLGIPLFAIFLTVAGVGAYAVQRKLR